MNNFRKLVFQNYSKGPTIIVGIFNFEIFVLVLYK